MVQEDERPMLRYVHRLGVAEMDIRGHWYLVEGDQLLAELLNGVVSQHGITMGSNYEQWSIFLNDEFNDTHLGQSGGKCYPARPRGEYYPAEHRDCF